MVYARSVTCPRCGAESKPGQKFCANCGLALAACPNCGASFESGPRFCADCGFSLAAQQAVAAAGYGRGGPR